jgi:hypothetical protein
MNNVNKHIEFKLTCEENRKVYCIDLLITRNKDKLAAVIFRNPTTTDITIHYISNQLIKHKLVSYRFFKTNNRINENSAVYKPPCSL